VGGYIYTSMRVKELKKSFYFYGFSGHRLVLDLQDFRDNPSQLTKIY